MPTITRSLQERVEAWEGEFCSPEATRSYPALRGGRGTRQPAADPVPARPRPRSSTRRPFAASSTRPRSSSPPRATTTGPGSPTRWRPRDLAHRRAGAGPERGPDRGDRPRPRPRPPALRAHRRAGPRRGAARALRRGFRHNEHSLRVVDVLEREGQGLNLTEQVRDGILSHTGAPRSRRRWRAGSCDSSTASPTSTTTSTTRCGPGSSPSAICRPSEIGCSGPTGSERIDALVHDLVEHSGEAGDIVQSERSAGRCCGCASSCSSASTSARRRAREHERVQRGV